METSTFPPSRQQFTLFPLLPPELRLKIWRATFVPRVHEIQVKPTPAPSTLVIHEPSSDVTPIDLRPLSRPHFPAVMHVCREARSEVLSVYRLCPTTPTAGFQSPYAYPCNIFHPYLDTLFVPIALYYLNASEVQIMFSGVAAMALGSPREFILDRLAADPRHVENVTSLAVCWSDMHVKDVGMLEIALRPYRALKELVVMFFEMRDDKEDIKVLQAKRGRFKPVLCMPGEAKVRGRYLARILDEYMEFAKVLNARFKEMEEEDSDEKRTFPEIKIRIARFEE